MKYSVVVPLVLVGILSANESVLSDLKQQEIEISKKQNIENFDKEKYDWVETIGGSIDWTKSDAEVETTTFSITISQPIFKSGGIYYAIQYANENNLFNTLSTRLQEKSLINSAFLALLNIKKIEKNIEIQTQKLANAKIDIIRKEEQYNSGLLDSSYLDNAILTKSAIQTALADLRMQKVELEQSFKNMSDLDAKDASLPRLSLMDENEYKNLNLELKQSLSSLKKVGYIEDMRFASYLPTLSLKASYSDVDTDPSLKTDGSSYRYGLSLSMPLFDMGRDNVLELARLDKLKAKVGHEQKLKEAQNEYDAVKLKLQIIDEKISLVQEDIQRYHSLVKLTLDKLSIGEVTSYDVDTMQNSKRSKEFELELLELEKQLELLGLYAKIDDTF